MQASLLFFLFVLTALTVFPSAAESPRLPNPVFQSLSTKNGLPQDVVNDILIDPHGFVWIATDGGVVPASKYSASGGKNGAHPPSRGRIKKF